MDIHRVTGRWRYGLLLISITAFLWGILPIALKVVLVALDPLTITWYRFFIAALALLIYKGYKQRAWPQLSRFDLKRSTVFLLSMAIIGLCGNYITYLFGLHYIPPTSATIIIQMAPILLLFGGMIFFKERFVLGQWVGFGIFISGLLLFFNTQLKTIITHFTTFSMGIFLVLIAAVFWALYALAQKQLLKTFSSETIMLGIYISGALFFLPFSKISTIFSITLMQGILLHYCALNTIIAYGCFAESLEHWQASRVSAVLAITPIITLGGTQACTLFFPGFIKPEQATILNISGALLVVVGSVVCSLWKKQK